MSPNVIAIDHPYPGLGAREEGSSVCWGEQFEIIICLDAPTEREIESVQKGGLEFRLNSIRDISWLSFRFLNRDGSLGIPWQECPIDLSIVPSIHRLSDADCNDLLERKDYRLTVCVTLIDCNGNTVKALRFLTLSPGLTKALIGQQLTCIDKNLGRASYEARVNQVFAEYPAGSIASSSSVICSAGD
jgi:hypothetical protein